MKKWIYSLLGLVLAGPIGAAIGYLIGMDGDKDEKGNSGEPKADLKSEFFISLMVLVAAMMKADGRVLKSELEVVKTFLRKNFKEKDAKKALRLLKDLLNNDYNVRAVADQIGRNTNYSTRLELLHLLWAIAAADGRISESEVQMARVIAQGMFLNEADARSIEAMYRSGSNNGWSNANQGWNNANQGWSSAREAKTNEDADWAYTILEISRDASDEEVKRAYRRMAMKFHPDKVSSLGPEAQRVATEKFRKVQEAYEYIKRMRAI